MTPQQIADQKAKLRAELERLDALEKAQRPALTAGQVWRSPEWGVSIVCAWDGVSGSIYNIERQSLVHYANGLADCFVFVGLARDVLRVVQPDAVEQVAKPVVPPEGMRELGDDEVVDEGDVRADPDGRPSDNKHYWAGTTVRVARGNCGDRIRFFRKVEQVAPVQDEPTGAELVKRLCWVREEEGSPWIGPAVIDQWDKEGRDGLWYMTMDKAVAGAWFIDAKLYREGVTP